MRVRTSWSARHSPHPITFALAVFGLLAMVIAVSILFPFWQ
jgi:hypothetical protein